MNAPLSPIQGARQVSDKTLEDTIPEDVTPKPDIGETYD
jgi:hypothetical protein